MSNKCLECVDKLNCCVNGFAFVGLDDAKKIKEHIKKDYNYFLDYSRLPKKTLNLLKNDDPSLEGYFRFSLTKKGRLLRLKKKDGRCIFLKDHRCSIYEVRPKICRIYPYWCVELIDGNLKVIEHDSELTCAISNLKNIKKEEEEEIKKLFENIILEAKDYKKNIYRFSKENLF